MHHRFSHSHIVHCIISITLFSFLDRDSWQQSLESTKQGMEGKELLWLQEKHQLEAKTEDFMQRTRELQEQLDSSKKEAVKVFAA